MDSAWWGVVAVLVIGSAVVAYGWLSDRRVTRERERALAAAPGDGPVPAYVTTASPRPEAVGLDDATREAIRAKLPGASSFDAGWPSADFVTDPESRWAVLSSPAVLVCPDDLDDVRDLVAVIRRLEPDRPPLVIVAPEFGAALLRTLAANSAHQAFLNLPVALDEPGRKAVCAISGATPVPREDLRAGYVPADALGACQTWVADQQTSWVIPEKLST